MIIDYLHTENTDGHGCPQPDVWGERELSWIDRELKEIGPQADCKGRQQEQHKTTLCPQADEFGEQLLIKD